jgi:hypothetical protein
VPRVRSARTSHDATIHRLKGLRLQYLAAAG